jgi:hypothetical protein
MPYSKRAFATKAQVRTAQAVAHGWKPKGSAKGFTEGFADKLLSEVAARKKKKAKAEMMMGKGAKPA